MLLSSTVVCRLGWPGRPDTAQPSERCMHVVCMLTSQCPGLLRRSMALLHGRQYLAGACGRLSVMGLSDNHCAWEQPRAVLFLQCTCQGGGLCGPACGICIACMTVMIAELASTFRVVLCTTVGILLPGMLILSRNCSAVPARHAWFFAGYRGGLV